MTELFKQIECAEHIVLIAHLNPDADSLGSASAMYTHMLRLQKKVTLFCATEKINPNLTFLPWFDKLRYQFPASCDLAISFDCGSISRLGVEIECDLINIDHHISNEAYGTINAVDTAAISTTQVLYDLFKAERIKINPKMATALYAGLLDDSDCFTSPKTDEKTFETASDLHRCGADIALCSASLVQTVSLAAMRLKGWMLQNAALSSSGRLVSTLVPHSMMDTTGAKHSDCEAALEESLFLPTVEVALMLRENRDGSVKGSIRGNGKIDLSEFAKTYGGGGHPHSAGFRIENMALKEAEKMVIEALMEVLKK